MAKKPAVVKKPTASCNKQLVDAIVAVKTLQDFIADHGDSTRAIEAVARVQKMAELTGGFESLIAALKIVGGESTAAEPEASQA